MGRKATKPLASLGIYHMGLEEDLLLKQTWFRLLVFLLENSLHNSYDIQRVEAGISR